MDSLHSILLLLLFVSTQAKLQCKLSSGKLVPSGWSDFDDGGNWCNKCTCDPSEDGEIVTCSTSYECPCKLADGSFATWGYVGPDSGDNYCNICTCEKGMLQCTEKACAPELPEMQCTLAGGEKVPFGWSGQNTAGQYCNRCTCLGSGQLFCTKETCEKKTCDINISELQCTDCDGTCELVSKCTNDDVPCDCPSIQCIPKQTEETNFISCETCATKSCSDECIEKPSRCDSLPCCPKLDCRSKQCTNVCENEQCTSSTFCTPGPVFCMVPDDPCCPIQHECKVACKDESQCKELVPGCKYLDSRRGCDDGSSQACPFNIFCSEDLVVNIDSEGNCIPFCNHNNPCKSNEYCSRLKPKGCRNEKCCKIPKCEPFPYIKSNHCSRLTLKQCERRKSCRKFKYFNDGIRYYGCRKKKDSYYKPKNKA